MVPRWVVKGPRAIECAGNPPGALRPGAGKALICSCPSSTPSPASRSPAPWAFVCFRRTHQTRILIVNPPPSYSPSPALFQPLAAELRPPKHRSDRPLHWASEGDTLGQFRGPFLA